MEMITVLDIEQLELDKNQKNFFINRITAHILKNKSKITKAHKHNSYLIVLFTKGSGRHEIDFNSYAIQPGSVFFLAPGKTHHWELSEDIDGYIFSHTESFFDWHFSNFRMQHYPFFYSIQNTPSLWLEEKNRTKIASLMESLYQEYKVQKAFQPQIILSYIVIIYIELSRLYLVENSQNLSKPTPYSEKFQHFQELLEMHYLVKKLPSQYADMLHISPKHLNRITQSLVGKTASAIISDRIILEAKRKLLHTKNSLVSICESLGYEDYSYFSKVFKKSSGLTPTEFLKIYK